MGFFEFLDEAKKTLGNNVKRFKNEKFMKAISAMCALVAFADGSVDAVEKQKMVGFIIRSEDLKVFKVSEIITEFNKHIDNLEFDVGVGEAEALKVIKAIKGDADACKSLILVGCAIGRSDDNFDEDEKNVVRKVCKELDLKPSDFSL